MILRDIKSNIDILDQMIAENIRSDRLISLLSEIFFFLEDRFDHKSTYSQDDANIFYKIATCAARTLYALYEIDPILKLEGNAEFILKSVEDGRDPSDISFFLARTFDAVRGPVANESSGMAIKLLPPLREFSSSLKMLIAQ